MLLVELVFALVLAPVLPDVVAPAVHHAVLKLPLKVATVGPLEAAVAAHLVVRPVPAVLAAVGPEVDAFALLDPVLEEAVVVAAIGPDLDPLAVLLVLRGHLRGVLDRIEIVLDVKPDILAEHAQACLPVLLPETLV